MEYRIIGWLYGKQKHTNFHLKYVIYLLENGFIFEQYTRKIKKKKNPVQAMFVLLLISSILSCYLLLPFRWFLQRVVGKTVINYRGLIEAELLNQHTFLLDLRISCLLLLARRTLHWMEYCQYCEYIYLCSDYYIFLRLEKRILYNKEIYVIKMMFQSHYYYLIRNCFFNCFFDIVFTTNTCCIQIILNEQAKN